MSAQSTTSKFSMTSQSMASLKYGKHIYIEKLNPPAQAIHVELIIVIYTYSKQGDKVRVIPLEYWM